MSSWSDQRWRFCGVSYIVGTRNALNIDALHVVVAVCSELLQALHADGLLASWICIRHAFRPSLRKMSYFPEFCSQQPLKIFQKFLNRIVAQTSNLYAIIFDSVKNAQLLSEMRSSDPTHRKMGIFSHIFARPPPRGGETCEILLAHYKDPPMPFHYLYNWLLPLARFRKSRRDKNRYR